MYNNEIVLKKWYEESIVGMDCFFRGYTHWHERLHYIVGPEDVEDL